MPAASGPIKVRRRKRAAPRRVSANVTPPAGDIASSGGNYGVPKARRYTRRRQQETHDVKTAQDLGRAKTFQHTPLFKRSVAFAAAKGDIPLHRLSVDDQGRVVEHAKRSLLGIDVGAKDQPFLLRLKPGGGIERDTGAMQREAQDKTGALQSAGLRVLNETTRPLHAIAGLAAAGPHGFTEGLVHNKPYTFGKLLRDAGAPGLVSAIGGTVLDIGADPTTYLTFGTGTAVKASAQAAARKATEEALARGLAKKAADRAGRAAASKVLADGSPARGLSAGFTVRGRAVKTSGRASAKVAQTLRLPQAGAKLHDSRLVQTAGRNLLPDFRPAGVAPAAHRAVRTARRRTRAQAAAGQRAAIQKGQALARTLKDGEGVQVIDAIENNTIGALPDHLQQVANAVKADYKAAATAERKRGILGSIIGDVPTPAASDAGVAGYVPHIPDWAMEAGSKGARAGRAAKLGSSRTRQLRISHAEKRAEDPELVSSNLPLLHATRLSASARGTADADLIAAVAKTGRKLTKDASWDRAAEAVYEVTPTGLRKLEVKGRPDMRAIETAANGGAGKFVILNKGLADDALKGITPKEGPVADLGRFFDRHLQGPVKTALTVPNPQYHLTNLYGDSFNAYLGDATVADFARSWRGMKALRRREKAAKVFGKIADPTGKGLKIGSNKVSYEKLIDEAEKAGAIRTGFIGRDLPELIDSQRELAQQVGSGPIARRAGKGRKVVSRIHPLTAIRHAGEYREDFVRLASYIGARKRGMTVDQAARHVADHHFDYGDLTEFERGVLRRVFPFYTFSARNTPLQVKTLLKRPGKYANLQKVREEAQQAAGLPAGYEGNLEGYDQRGLPIPTPAGLLYPKLPAMDLNRLNPDAADQVQQLIAMVSPVIKTPAELGLNYNAFFREPIDPLADQTGGKVHTLVPAPDVLGKLPGAVRDKLGLKQQVDKRSGRKIWVWPARNDYLARLIPSTATATQLATSTANRQGFDRERKAISYLTGLKVKPYDAQSATINDLYRRRSEIDGITSNMRDQGQRHTKAYERLLAERRKINRRVYKLKKTRGDKILPSTGGPSKRRGGGDGGFAGAGGSSGGF